MEAKGQGSESTRRGTKGDRDERRVRLGFSFAYSLYIIWYITCWMGFTDQFAPDMKIIRVTRVNSVATRIQYPKPMTENSSRVQVLFQGTGQFVRSTSPLAPLLTDMLDLQVIKGVFRRI